MTPRICTLPFQRVHLHARKLRDFLQGQWACDINMMHNNRMLFACYCDRQGRTVGQGLLGEDGTDKDSAWLLTESSLIAMTLKNLMHYGRFSGLVCKPETGMRCLGILHADEEGTYTHLNQTPIGQSIMLDYPGACRRQCLLLPYDQAEQWLQTHPHTAVPYAAWLKEDTRIGLPQLTRATQAQHQPPALNLDAFEAYSLKKGCYLGQEILARMTHRGQSKRQLCAFTLNRAQAELEPNRTLYNEARRPCGSIITCFSNSEGRQEGLASLSRTADLNSPIFLTEKAQVDESTLLVTRAFTAK